MTVKKFKNEKLENLKFLISNLCTLNFQSNTLASGWRRVRLKAHACIHKRVLKVYLHRNIHSRDDYYCIYAQTISLLPWHFAALDSDARSALPATKKLMQIITNALQQKKCERKRTSSAYLLVMVTGVAGPCGLGSKRKLHFQLSMLTKTPPWSAFFLSHSPLVIVPICIKIYINFNFFLLFMLALSHAIEWEYMKWISFAIDH